MTVCVGYSLGRFSLCVRDRCCGFPCFRRDIAPHSQQHLTDTRTNAPEALQTFLHCPGIVPTAFAGRYQRLKRTLVLSEQNKLVSAVVKR